MGRKGRTIIKINNKKDNKNNTKKKQRKTWGEKEEQ